MFILPSANSRHCLAATSCPETNANSPFLISETPYWRLAEILVETPVQTAFEPLLPMSELGEFIWVGGSCLHLKNVFFKAFPLSSLMQELFLQSRFALTIQCVSSGFIFALHFDIPWIYCGCLFSDWSGGTFWLWQSCADRMNCYMMIRILTLWERE